MQKFERFIIYPMLFIGIFFSFAEDGVHQTTAQQVHDEIIAKSIYLTNSNGETTIILDGEDGIVSTYENRKNTTNLGNSTTGSGMINVYGKADLKDHYGVSIGTSDSGSGFIQLKNKHDVIVLQLGTSKDSKNISSGHGMINIYDKYGEDGRSYIYK